MDKQVILKEKIEEILESKMWDETYPRWKSVTPSDLPDIAGKIADILTAQEGENVTKSDKVTNNQAILEGVERLVGQGLPRMWADKIRMLLTAQEERACPKCGELDCLQHGYAAHEGECICAFRVIDGIVTPNPDCPIHGGMHGNNPYKEGE